MKISWVVLAEGITQDAKGAFSLIGLNQNIVFVDSLPSQTKRALLAHLESAVSEGADDLSPATFTFTVKSPSGAIISAQTGQIQSGEFPFKDLPATADIPFEAMIPIGETGEYLLGFQIRYSTGRVEEASSSLFVLENSENPQFKKFKEAAGVTGDK